VGHWTAFSPVPLLAVASAERLQQCGYTASLRKGSGSCCARQPVAQVVADPLPPRLRARLQGGTGAVFASQQLKLPDNRSYRVYAERALMWCGMCSPRQSCRCNR
jgi:predicted aminopeptidase